MPQVRRRSVTTYAEAEAFLFSRLNYERTSPRQLEEFRLERLAELLAHLGNPHLSVPCVHIAGTKGKGSTAAMTASILQAAGLKTGLFTSPHLSRVEERFRVDGEMPAEEEFIALVNHLAERMDSLGNLADELTFFELTTALAWLRFQQAGCDFAVMEVGVGGRLDTTNLCSPAVCVITNISYDHTELLGDTLEAIAAEKAGIIKPQVPVISGVEEPSAAAVIEQIARERRAPLFRLGTEIDFSRSNSGARIVTPHGSAIVPVPLTGRHQTANAALAVAAAMQLKANGFGIADSAFAAGMSRLRWPLRIELLQQNPPVIVDAAHNVASIEALGTTLKEQYPHQRKVVIFGASREKNIAGMLRALDAFADAVVFSACGTNPRSVPPDDLLRMADPILRCERQATADVACAWRLARSSAGDELVCCTGSFFLAAEFRDWFLNRDT